MKGRPVTILLSIVFFCSMTTQLLAARSADYGADTSVDGDFIWTSWDAAHYTLIDDGNFLWIGTGNGLVQVNKASGGYRRYAAADGLPHSHVTCGAVDLAGNRWFGGDGGLSKLDAAGKWTHFNRDNSPLAGSQVSGIAVTADGDIWVGYTDQAAVNRLSPDGIWSKYPNRETAVSLAYNNIKQTINNGDLWTAAGDDVWAGYSVFDGQKWVDRSPEASRSSPQELRVDSGEHVWAIGSIRDSYGVLEWDGAQWTSYELSCNGCVSAGLTDLAIDKNDVVWAGGDVSYPYSRGGNAYGRLPDEPGSFTLDRYVGGVISGLSDMTATDEGLWITGANWLQKADGSVQKFEDVPYLNNVTRLIVDGEGTTWLHSGRYNGVLQILDDNGTGTLRDDSGQIVLGNIDSVEMEIAANGDLWLAWIEDAVRFQLGHGPRRYFNGTAVDYVPPRDGVFIYDIYVEDDVHTWFVYDPYISDGSPNPGIWRLDDRGTPTDFSDDVWTTYEVSEIGADASVAARDGKLWYGDSTGVYLYDDGGWRQLSSEATEELVPADNGVLFAAMDGVALVIEAGGKQYWRSVPEIVLNNYDLVRSTTRRNKLWRNAADGAIWFWHYSGELGRWDGGTQQAYKSPSYGGYIEVDQNNHVWLIEEAGQWQDKTLWRISPRPDFRLSTGPATWFITPGGSRTIAVGAVSIEGYANKVTLSIKGLPAGVTGQVNPSEITPGKQAVVVLTAHDALPGTTAVTLRAVSGDIIHNQKITLAVVAEAHESWLPLTAFAP